MHPRLATLALVVYFLVSVSEGKKKVPPNCCLPEVFEFFVGEEGGTNAASSGDAYTAEYRLYYDFPRKRWGVITGKDKITGDWKGDMIEEDYKNHVKYVGGIGPNSGPACMLQDIDAEWDIKRYCIPETAEYTETINLGYGEERLSYDVFQWTDTVKDVADNVFDMTVKSGITDDCMFINEIAIWKSDKFNNTVYISFFDLKDTITPGNNVFEEITSIFGECRKEFIEDLFDQMRTNTMRFFAKRIRDTPPEPEPEPEPEESSENEAAT